MSEDNDVKLRQEVIKELISAALAPVELQVEDESHLHEDHPEAQKHGGKN